MTSPKATISGIHHVTAITADAQKNVDFYCGVLGLRLVKVTVNFDDPSSYHLYYGDELGRPGTIMTFFAWPGASRRRAGLLVRAADELRSEGRGPVGRSRHPFRRPRRHRAGDRRRARPRRGG